MRINKFIGVLFLVIQCASIFLARFIPERFFCWAPFDEHTMLETTVLIDTIELSSEQVARRYRYGMNGWEPRAIHNVFNIVEQFEKSYGLKDSAEITIKYSINGHPARKWHYPKPSKQ